MLDGQCVGQSEAAQTAERSRVEATADLDAARTVLEQLTVASAAAGLRPHLEVGHACPVCDQTVAVLPPALREPALDDARSALATADERQRATSTAASQAQTRLAALTSRRAAQIQRIADLDSQLQGELPQQPSGDDRAPANDHRAVEILLTRLDEAQAAHQSALHARDTAQSAARAAERSPPGSPSWPATAGRCCTSPPDAWPRSVLRPPPGVESRRAGLRC